MTLSISFMISSSVIPVEIQYTSAIQSYGTNHAGPQAYAALAGINPNAHGKPNLSGNISKP